MSLVLRTELSKYETKVGAIFIYKVPLKTRILALYETVSINGEPDPKIFNEDRKKRDSTKFMLFCYAAAKLFIVDWEEVTTLDKDENEIPLNFESDLVERLPVSVLVDFVNDVVFPLMSEEISAKDDESVNPT